jgi:protein-disulfide isomerase
MKAAKSAGYIDSVIVTSVAKAGASTEEIKQAAEEAGMSQENVVAGITTAEEGATGSGATNTPPIYIPITFKQASSPTPTVNREELVEEAISPN